MIYTSVNDFIKDAERYMKNPIQYYNSEDTFKYYYPLDMKFSFSIGYSLRCKFISRHNPYEIWIDIRSPYTNTRDNWLGWVEFPTKEEMEKELKKLKKWIKNVIK